MQTNKKINLADLRTVLLKVLDTIEKEGLKEIVLSHDFYWDINASQKYDPYSNPSKLSIGQLSDDLKTIISLLNNEKEPIRYDLVWLSTLLRYFGEKPNVLEISGNKDQ